MWITTNLENSYRDGNTRPPYLLILRILYADQEATVRTGHGTMDWFQIVKGVQGCILSPCLTSRQSTSCEMLGWMNHKLESRLLGEISTASDTQMIPLDRK